MKWNILLVSLTILSFPIASAQAGSASLPIGVRIVNSHHPKSQYVFQTETVKVRAQVVDGLCDLPNDKSREECAELITQDAPVIEVPEDCPKDGSVCEVVNVE